MSEKNARPAQGTTYDFATDGSAGLADVDHVGHQFNLVERQPQENPNPLSAGLRLERVPTPCVMVIFGVSGDLTARHPLRVTLALGDSGPSVRDREVDVAIGVMQRPPPGCWGRRLGQLPYGVYGTAEVLARKPEPLWVTRALTESYSPESAWERAHASQAATRAPFDALVSLVAGGVGLGLIPRVIAGLHPQLVEVKEHRARVASLERTAWILTHPDLRKTPRVKVLRDELTKRVRAGL